MYEPQNYYEAHAMVVWHCLTRGRQTKAKHAAREAFYGMLRTQRRSMAGHITAEFFDYIETEYAKDLL